VTSNAIQGDLRQTAAFIYLERVFHIADTTGLKRARGHRRMQAMAPCKTRSSVTFWSVTRDYMGCDENEMSKRTRFEIPNTICDDGKNSSPGTRPGSCELLCRQSAISPRLSAWGKAHSFHLRASHELQCFAKLLGGRQPAVVVPPRIFSKIEIEMMSADPALGFEPTLQVGPEAFDLSEPGRSPARGDTAVPRRPLPYSAPRRAT